MISKVASCGGPALQVSAFGDDSGSDTGDVWTVHGYHAKEKVWERDADIELKCVAVLAAVAPIYQSCNSMHSGFDCRLTCKIINSDIILHPNFQ
jgi:hypothetical protein